MINATDINPATGKAYAIDPTRGIWDDNYFDKTYGAQNRTEQQMKDLPIQQKAATDAKFAQDKGDLTDFNTRFSTAVPSIISNTSNKYNLPGLLDQANGLNKRVSELQTNSNGAGAGGYASSDQVDKAVQTNYLPRAQQATTNLQTGTTLAQNEESQLFQPYQTESTLLNERLAREATSYTAEQQRELDGLVEKMKAGVALTQTEMDNANRLATAEKTYQGVLASANAQVKTAQIGASNVTIGPGSTYFNPATNAYFQPNVGSGVVGR